MINISSPVIVQLQKKYTFMNSGNKLRYLVCLIAVKHMCKNDMLWFFLSAQTVLGQVCFQQQSAAPPCYVLICEFHIWGIFAFRCQA